MMANADNRRPPASARWDGRRVLFELLHDGRQVPCAVSPDALRELTSRRCFRQQDVLDSFLLARAQVEEIARGKLRSRATPPPMPLTVWVNDVEDHITASPPSESTGR
jgi:hypothetical protein